MLFVTVGHEARLPLSPRLKKQLAEDMNLFIAPIRERIKSLVSDEKYIDDIAKLGAEKAHVTAQKTIRGVRELIGFRSVNF